MIISNFRVDGDNFMYSRFNAYTERRYSMRFSVEERRRMMLEGIAICRIRMIT